MIKLNTPYTIENGDTVIFTEGKKGTINGTYTDSTLTGTYNENLLKATFHNKKVNVIGLIEIIFHENGFTGKWKSGLEPGPMRGKWIGELIANAEISDTNCVKTNDTNETQYNINEIVKNGVFSFTKKLEEIINEASKLEDDAQVAFLDNFYKQLNECFNLNNQFIFLGKIAERITENSFDIWTSFYLDNEDDCKSRFTLSIDELRNSGLIKQTLDKKNFDVEKINSDDDVFYTFLNYLSCYFIYSLDNVVEQNDAEELAEFIFSISANNYSSLTDDDNIIADQILDILKAYGFDIKNFEGECTIFSNYYLKSSVESGYNYIEFSESIIEELYCP
jgi:hypothetical protein